MATGEINVPPYLEPLLMPTPSGVMKLMAAWDGLSTETQIMVLSLLPTRRYPDYLATRVRDKALSSDVAYIRYLSYQGVYLDSDNPADIAVNARLESDPNPLVRYSRQESEACLENTIYRDPEIFFALPHEAQLARVRLLDGDGECIAKIVSYALDNHMKDDRISELDLYEVLSDYLLRPGFRQHYSEDNWRDSYDGFGEYQAGRDIESLWRLVPKCPPSIARLLIEVLPPGAGLSSGIPEDVVAALTDYQMDTLLFRRDIKMIDLRQALFWDINKKDNVRNAAIFWNFSIDNAGLSKILSWPDDARFKALRSLATYAHDLRLCVYSAIEDYLSLSDRWENMDGVGSARRNQEFRLTQLQSGGQRDDELRQLRLYILARQAAPLKEDSKGYPPEGELDLLAQHVVRNNTWATFVAFDAAWRANYWKVKGLETYLPRIQDVDPDDEACT
ncbi:hypothetical protein [Gluconacetobacter diazotrophicus]|uniref:hypothetical protein n=1 Tax=Gluconacetobacter diazotrophicus TaxID=33996 RepID=UPI00119B947B|nr:hypothetical protein [Gluconacetobacter diazotrophicus]TWB05647.1 hypothetical protein FBZ86_11574 [Gluconacetobacter diazotrophicus]